MKLLKNFIYFKDIFKYNKLKTIFKSLKLPKLRKNDYNYYQKLTSASLIFFILFNLGFRIPFLDFFRANAENKEYVNLVAVVVQEDIYNSVDSVLKRYAKDIESVLSETKVVLVPTPKDAGAFQIASLIESLYYEGYKSVDKDADFESKLIGTVLVGDIPLAIVKDGANFSKTIIPYTDFDNKTYVYDHEEEIYLKSENLNEKIEPEIWHGVVSPNTGNESDDMQAIIDYFDKNHDFYIGKGLFDRKKGVINGNPEDKIPGELSSTGAKIDKDLDEYKPYIFYFDQFREVEALNNLNYAGYKSAQKNKEDLQYNRLSKELARDVKEDVYGEEEQEITDLINDTFSGTELPDGKVIAAPEPVTEEEAAEDRYHCRFANEGSFYGQNIKVSFDGSCKNGFTVSDGAVRTELEDGRLWKPIATESPHTLAILGPHDVKVSTCTITREGGSETQDIMPKNGESKDYQGSDIFEKAPDILTRYGTSDNAKTFKEVFNFSALSELRKNIYNAGRRSKNKDKVNADFIPEIISTIDLISDQAIKNLNDTLEAVIDDVVINGGSTNMLIFESAHIGSVEETFNDYINYFYGKKGADISKPEDCSIYRGSLTNSGNLVEANRGYNIKLIEPDNETVGKACIKACKNDTECITRGYWGGNSPINLNEEYKTSTGGLLTGSMARYSYDSDPSEKNNGFFNLKKHNLYSSITPLFDIAGSVEICDEEKVHKAWDCGKGIGILVSSADYSIANKVNWWCGTDNLERGAIDLNDILLLDQLLTELSTDPNAGGELSVCEASELYIDGVLVKSYVKAEDPNGGGEGGEGGEGGSASSTPFLYSFILNLQKTLGMTIINSLISKADADSESEGGGGGGEGGGEDEVVIEPCRFYYKTMHTYIRHESPTSEELSTQVDGVIASSLPVDKDKYIDFVGIDFAYKKIDYPQLFRFELEEGQENNMDNVKKGFEDYLKAENDKVNEVIMTQVGLEGVDFLGNDYPDGDLRETDFNKYLEDLEKKEYESGSDKKDISYLDTLQFALYWKNIDNISEKYAFVLENYLSDQFNNDVDYGIPKNKKSYELSYMGAPGNASSMYIKMDPEAKFTGNPYEEEASKNASLDNMLTGLNLGSGDNSSNSSEDDSEDTEDECGAPDGVPIMEWFPAILCRIKTMLPPTIKISKSTCGIDDTSDSEDEVDLSDSGGSDSEGSDSGWDEVSSEETKSCDGDEDKNGINDCIEKGLTNGSIDLSTNSAKYNYNSNGQIKIALLNSEGKLLSYDNSTSVNLELSKLELVAKDGTKEIVYNGTGSSAEEKEAAGKYFNFNDTAIKVSEGKADYAFSTLTSDVDAYIKAWIEISNYKKTSKIYLEKTIKVEIRGNNLAATTYKIERDEDATLNILSGIDMVLASNVTNIYLLDGINSNVEDEQNAIDNSSTSKEKLIFSLENYSESGSKIDVKYPLRINLYKDSEKIIDDKLINLSDTVDYYGLTALKKSGEYILQIEDAEGFKINKTFIVKADEAYRGEIVLGASIVEVGGVVTTNYLIGYDKYGNVVAGDLYNVEGEIDGDGIEFVQTGGQYDDKINFQMLEGFKVFRIRTTNDKDENTISFKLTDISGKELFTAENNIKTIEGVYLFLQPLQTDVMVGSGATTNTGTGIVKTSFSGSSLTGSLMSGSLSLGNKITGIFGTGSEFNGVLSNGDSFIGEILSGALFSGTMSTDTLFKGEFSNQVYFKGLSSTGSSFTGFIESGTIFTGTTISDGKTLLGTSFNGFAFISTKNEIITGTTTGIYGYKFSVRDEEGKIMTDFDSRLYLSLNTIYGESLDSYVPVKTGTGEVYFTTKQTAGQNIKLSFQIEGLKNVYTKYIDILPEKPIKMDLILSNDKIEASEEDYTNLKIELKDRYGNLVFNDSSTNIELELKEDYEKIVKPKSLTGVVSSGTTTFKINATKMPGIAYLKVKANPLFTSSFKIPGQAPIAKEVIVFDGFTDENGLTDLGKKFFQEYDSDNYSSRFYKLEDMEKSADFMNLSSDIQSQLKTLWEANNSINIEAQNENIVKIETFYFWNSDKIKGSSYNSIYTVLLGAEYGDISQEDYLAGGILFDKENRGLTVTSLLNNPYNYKDIVSINSAGKIQVLDNSQDITQDIRYITNIDKEKRLYFDIYNYALSEYLGKIYFNLDKGNDLKLCEGDTDMNFTECAKDLEKTTILLKNIKEGYTGSLDGDSLILKDNYGQAIFKVTEDGEISNSAFVTIENYVSEDGEVSKESVFSIKQGDEVIAIFSFNLIDAELNVTRDKTLFSKKLESLKNSVIVYLISSKYGDRLVQTKEEDTMMIYYDDPFADESDLNVFSSAEGFTYESFKENLKAGWSESNKALLLYAAGESIGESTKKYASFSLINLGDPVVSLKNVKKKFKEEEEHPACSDIEWKDGDICDRQIKSGLKVSFNAISVLLEQKIVDILENDTIEMEGVKVVGNPWVIYKKNGKWKAETWERMAQNQKSKFKYALADSGVPLKKGVEIGFVVSGLIRMGTSNQKIKTSIAWVKREDEDSGDSGEEETNTGSIYRSFNSTTGIQISKDEKNVAYKLFDYNNDKLQDLLLIKNDSYAEIIENRGNFNFNHKGNLVYIPEMGTNGMMEAGDFTGDGYADIFYITKGKPYLLNNVEKNFSKISLEEQFVLSGGIVKISSFDMDNDKIKDIVTMDSLGKIHVFYGGGTANNPLFSKLEAGDGFTITLNEEKNDGNGAIYYDGLASINNENALKNMKEDNDQLIENFDIKENKQSINTEQIDGMIFDNISYNANDETTEEVFDESKTGDKNYGDVYKNTEEGMSEVEEYSGSKPDNGSNNTKAASFIRNKYASSFGINIEKKYEDLDKGTLEPLDKVKITVDITNNTGKSMKKVAYAEKVQEVFTLSDDEGIIKTSKTANIKRDAGNYDFIIDGFTLASGEKMTLEYEVALIPLSYGEIQTGFFEKGEAGDDEYGDILLKVDKKSCDTKPDIFRSVPGGFDVDGTLVHTGVIANSRNFSGAYDLIVDGNYAYMTSFLGDRVNIIDVTNPTKPIMTGSLINNLSGAILDVTPTITGSLINNGSGIKLDGASSIIKSGNFLYVASNESDTIQVIDVSNPLMPTATGQLTDTTKLDGVRGLAKSGDYLYATVDNYDALQIIDIKDPINPKIIGTIRDTKILNGARGIKVRGNYAYITSFDGNSFVIVDITDPKSPIIKSNIKDSIKLKGAWGIEIYGNYAYVGANLNDSVRVIDISDSSSPNAITSISGGSYSLSGPMDLLADENKLYITSFGLDSINVADISDPTNPIFKSKVRHNLDNPLLEGVTGLFKEGDIVYATSYNSSALEILALTKKKSYTGRAFEKGKIESTCNEENLKLPEELEKNNIDEDNNGVPDYIDKLTESAKNADKSEIKEYSEDSMSDINQDSDGDGIPDTEDKTPTYNSEDEDTTSFLDDINEGADTVSEGIDELGSGLCNGFGGGACISSPVNWAPLAPGNDPVLFGYPIGDGQKVGEGFPIFAAKVTVTPFVWPPSPLGAGGRLDLNPEGIGQANIRLFVTPTITGAIGLAICFQANTMSKTESPPSLFPIIGTNGKCIIAAFPFLGCSGDGSDGDVSEKTYPVNFGGSGGPNGTKKEEGDFSVANGSCVDTKELAQSKGFSLDDTFVKNYLDYKETKSDDTLSELVDTFKDISKGDNNVLETKPLINLGGSENKSDTVDISFIADIDVNALASGEFKDVIKLKSNLIKSFPAFLMDWVNSQIEEIVTKLTSLPSIIVILPEFSGIADSSWGNFFDGIKKSFKDGQKEWEKTEDKMNTDISKLEQDKQAKNCSNITSSDEGYYDCLVLDILQNKRVLEKDYNPSQTTSGIKAVYDFIGSLPLVALKSQTVNVNIPRITNASLFKAKINFEFTKKQWQEEIKRVEKARGSLDAAEKSAGDKIIVDAKALVRSLDKNIAALEEYKKFPQNLVKLLNKKEDRLEQILCSVDTIYKLFGGRLGDNGKRFKKWVELYLLIKAIMKSWQIILDLFDEYDKSCKECKNERYDLRTFIWKLVSIIIPKIPIIQFPKWPNIVLDLHNIKVGLNITLPEFNFNARPIVIPRLPNLYLPDVPSVKVILPSLPVLPSIELPTLPDLPTLPKIELPNLPPPPKLPKLLSAIEAVLNILKIVTKIMCLIQKSPFAPEWTVGIKIAYLTDRQGFNPLDYIDISMPQYSYSFVDSINITTYINFEVDAEFLLEFAKQGVKPLNNFTNDVVNMFSNKIPNLDFSNVVPDQIKVDLSNKSGMLENDNLKSDKKITTFQDIKLNGLTRFFAYGFLNIYGYINTNKDETVSNEEFIYLVNKGLANKNIVGDEGTQEIRKLWKDVANMTYSKEDKFIEDLKQKNKAKFDTLKGIINTEKQITRDQINSIKNFEDQSNIKFISDIKKSNIDGYNELMRKHNLETVKATINLLSDENKEQKDLQKDGEELINRISTGLNNYGERLLAANTGEGASSGAAGGSCSGGSAGSQEKNKYSYKGIYIIEDGNNYRLFDYIEELSGKEELGHVDIDNDSDEDLIYMVKNELYIKQNTKIEVEKVKNTISEPLVIDIKDNKFYNGEIFYESLNNVKETVSFDGFINFAFDAPTDDNQNNFRLEFYTLIDKYLNEDYDNYTPKGVMKNIIDSFSDIDNITKLPEKSQTGYSISSNLGYIYGVGNNINENVVLETKKLLNIKDDLETEKLVKISFNTKLYSKDKSFTIKYVKEGATETNEITVGEYENIKFDEGIKIYSLSGDAFVESKETITLSGQTIKDYLYLPLFSGTKIYLENEDNPTFNESSHIDIRYYDETENDIDFRTVKQYELYDLGAKKTTYMIYAKEANDFYYSRGFPFKQGILGTKTNQALLSPQVSNDTSVPEINLEDSIKIPVYQRQTYNFTPYLEDSSGYKDFYIDFDLENDSDSDGDLTNDRDTKEDDIQVTTKTVKVDFGPYEEVFTSDIGITLKDLAGNTTYTKSKLEVYAPDLEISSQTGDIVTGKINEELESMPINLYRYRGGVISKLLDKTEQQKIYTSSTGSYDFDIKATKTKGLNLTKNSIEVASINENTGKITIKNLAGANIKVLSSNNKLNDKPFVKIILEDSSSEIYYEYFDYNVEGDLFILDNLKDANGNGIYLKINDLDSYGYYKIPLTAPYNPGAISIYSLSDKEKTPLFSIYPNGEINTYGDQYELIYSESGDNVVLKLYDNKNDKDIGEVLMNVVDGNYIVR